MRIDIMTDIETLGTEANSTIFQIAAVAFDMDTGDYLGTFNKVADIAENASYDLTVSGATLKWWLSTNKELLEELLLQGEGSSADLIKNFHEWLTGWTVAGEVFLWGNGILFDNNMLKTAMEREGLTYPIFFRNDRDLRTIVELTAQKLDIPVRTLRDNCYNPERTAHHGLHDAYNQIDLVTACYRELTRKEGATQS